MKQKSGNPVEVEFIMEDDDGEPSQVLIAEDDLPLSEGEMRRLHITPAKLEQVFAEARALAKDIKPSDRAHIVADEDQEGNFHVLVVGYSAQNDPLLQETKGSA